MRGAHLRSANLREADLTKARFAGAYLRGASFRDAILNGADFQDAIFSADLGDPTRCLGPNFQGAKIDKTTRLEPDEIKSERVNNFALAYFGVAELKEWDDPKNVFLKQLLDIGITRRTDDDLGRKKLRRQNFDGFAMTGADLRDFDLQGSTFRGNQPGRDPVMDLTGALFSGADLTGVRFHRRRPHRGRFQPGQSDTSLPFSSGANLSGAKFQGSNWKSAIIIDERIRSFLEFSEGEKSKP